MGLGRVIKRPEKRKTLRLPSGRVIFPDALKLFGLIQADDYSMWLAATVKTQTRHEAVCLFNQYYGYPTNGDKVVGYTLTGLESDKYLHLCQLGGMDLPHVVAMEPYKVREVVGLYDWE